MNRRWIDTGKKWFCCECFPSDWWSCLILFKLLKSFSTSRQSTLFVWINRFKRAGSATPERYSAAKKLNQHDNRILPQFFVSQLTSFARHNRVLGGQVTHQANWSAENELSHQLRWVQKFTLRPRHNQISEKKSSYRWKIPIPHPVDELFTSNLHILMHAFRQDSRT